MAAFPLAPRFAKMCVASARQCCALDAVAHKLLCRFGVVGCLSRILVSEPYGLTAQTIAVVAALTVGDPFVRLAPTDAADDPAGAPDSSSAGRLRQRPRAPPPLFFFFFFLLIVP